MRNIDRKKLLTIISGITLLIGSLANWIHLLPSSITIIIFAVSIVTGGYFVFLAAIRGLFEQRFLNINFLVTIATIGAIYINQLGEAAAVVFLFSLAEMFEEFGMERSRKALETLVKKSPKTAILKNGQTVPVDQIKVKEVVVVKPGDLIPLDGLVITGSSSVNEATITGESVPKDKREGDSVFGGTLNQNGYLEIEVTKEAKDSTYSKIIKLVEEAQESRAPAQKFIDIFAKFYTPAVVIGALLIATIPPLIFGGNYMDWLTKALTLLVIACPCALVISTPVAIASAIGGASKRGVLIKGGKYLEALGKLKAIAFDKTGTLTEGKPYVSDVVAFHGYSKEEILADASGIAQFSSHPLSKCIGEECELKAIKPHSMEKYQNIAGQGGTAQCLVCNDLKHCLGNLKLIGANSKACKEVLKKTEQLEKEGKTVVLISEGDKVMGALAISDKLREKSKEMVEKLNKMNIQTTMLTGDNQYVADFVAEEVGVKKTYASLLPDQKVEKVEELKKQYGYVGMVGDGVNDAPSLATSTVGIAMGTGGSDVAIETADVALMNDNLLNIPYAAKLGVNTVRIIKQNIYASLGVKVLFLLLALIGQTNLVYAIAADSGMALLVILNSLRLFNA